MAKESAPTVSDEGFFMAIIEQLGAANIDWQKVADKSGIVSKGAASKRWSRLKIKYEKESGVKMGGGASPTKGGASPTKVGTPAADGEEAIVKEKPAATKKKPAAKKGGRKRKAAEQEEDDEEAEEDSKRVKAEVDEDDL
ncbi:hypothetical protein LTR10_001581 [Elasticomyces elasticus]|nr:hypothetical protein LTR10_001581 [Elasticomyces elasticus]KAK4975085.1 hypothetical protein LTR42_004295 [Elasticomyces elasticus]